ncbi:MAG: phosphatidate cytidylyltransferase [Nannocystaceae bacterium]
MLAAMAPSLVRLFLWVYGGLVVVSLGTRHRRLQGPALAPVRRAVLAWWLPAGVGGLAVSGGPWAAALLFAAVGVGCLREFLRFWPDERHPVVDGLAAAAIAPIHALACAGALDLGAGLLLVWAAAVLPLAWSALHGPAGVVTATSRRLLGLVLCGLGLAHVTAVAASPEGAPLLALLLIAVMVGDSFQYFFGKLIGGRRLAPRVSPRKTWSGAIGGVATAALALALAAPSVLPVSAAVGALCGALLSAVGLVGDLLISAIKRDVGVKDSGAVIPGQGGLLDRCDSLLLAAPLFYHAVAPLLR